jgi:hypothetical protein
LSVGSLVPKYQYPVPQSLHFQQQQNQSCE